MVAMAQDTVTAKGRSDVGHIPYQPMWLLIVRGFQMLLAVLVLAMSAYAGSVTVFFNGYGVAIFTFVWTLIFLCYIEITIFFAPGGYNKYAHLVLECLSVIFWLTSFSCLAVIAVYLAYYDGISRYDYSGVASATAAGAALGAFNFALFCGSLISFGIYLHRHRRAEGEARAAGTTGNAVIEEHKMEPMASQQPINNNGYQTQQQGMPMNNGYAPQQQQQAYPTQQQQVPQQQMPYQQQQQAYPTQQQSMA